MTGLKVQQSSRDVRSNATILSLGGAKQSAAALLPCRPGDQRFVGRSHAIQRDDDRTFSP